MKKIIVFLISMLLYSGSAFSQFERNNIFDAECLNVERDGSETVRMWASGRNKQDAVEQVKKDAVWCVLFYGVTKGSGGCSLKPLLLEVNAKTKYQSYFNVFFKDGGEYLNYVSLEDKKNFSNQKQKGKVQDNYAVTVRVLRSELQTKLIEDNIIKP